MRQTWRWFGPKDLVSIDDVRQAGVEGVVSALHHIPPGDLWPSEEIERRKSEIGRMSNGDPSNLAWEVVESLPVSEDIKRQSGDWRQHIANYKLSLENIAKSGIEIVCYNFMPVLDWTRTDLAWRLPHGGTCMRFDHIDFACFDLYILGRNGAREGYAPDVAEEAERRFSRMPEARKAALADNVAFGLPGSAESLGMSELRNHLEAYLGIDAEQLRRHFVAFLEEVAPLAQKLGLRLCCHPDDPPVPLLGLPRIMSTAAHYDAIMRAVDIPANGITLCSGSFESRPDNDARGLMEQWGDRVHFIHLRNVRREGDEVGGSFYEAEHLCGNTDMVGLIAEILKEEARRRESRRHDHEIPMRPDHGQDILDDLNRRAQPGYPAIGRLKGLAELRGIMTALSHETYGRFGH